VGGAMPVDEIRVLPGGNVSQVRGAHTHLPPHGPVFERLAEEIADGALLKVETRAHLLELGEEAVRVLKRPVGEHDDVLAVVGDWVGSLGVNDERAVVADLLLHARVAVIPIRTALPYGELV